METRFKTAKQYYDQHTIDVDAFKTRLQQRIQATPKSLFNGWKKKAGIAFALPLTLFAATMAVGFTSPEIAEKITSIPYIGKAFNLLNIDFFTNGAIQQAVNHGYSTKLGKESTSSGITLKVGNAYFDKNNLYFDVLESYDKSLSVKPVVSINDMDITLNGTPLRDAHVAYGSNITRLTNNQAGGSVIINADPERGLPETAAVQVNITKIGTITGDWDLSFEVSRVSTDFATKTYMPNSEAQAKAVNPDNGIGNRIFSYQINKIEIGPAQTNFYGVFTLPSDLQHIPTLWVEVKDDENHTLGGITSGSLIKKEGDKEFVTLNGFVTSPDHASHELRLHARFDSGFSGGFETPKNWDLTIPLK